MGKRNEEKAHYESLISLFKYFITISLSLLSIFGFFIGYVTYMDGKEMREDLRLRKHELEANAKEIKEDLKKKEAEVSSALAILSEKVDSKIASTSQEALTEISSIKQEATEIARLQAEKKINQVFDNNHLDEFIEKMAEERMKPQINSIVDNRISINEDDLINAAIANLLSQNEITVSTSLNYLHVNNKGKYKEEQIQKIISAIESRNFKEEYKSSVAVLLLAKESPASTKYFKGIFTDINSENHMKSYSFFYISHFSYDYMFIENTIYKELKLTKNTNSYTGMIESLSKVNTNNSLRLLNSKLLVDLIYDNVSQDQLYSIKNNIEQNTQKSISKEDLSKTYLFTKKS